MLTDISALDNVNQNLMLNASITNNSSLSMCGQVASICAYFADSTNPGTISANAPGCTTRPEVTSHCSTNQCTGDLNFFDQAAINRWPTDNPNCQHIIGNITVSRADIMDLSPLQQILTVSGNINIEMNPLLTTIQMNHIIDIGGDLNINDNIILNTLNGFNGLLTLGGSMIINNNIILHTLIGFNNIQNIIDNLYLGNGTFSTVNAFQALTHINGTYSIIGTEMMAIPTIPNLVSIGKNLNISSNPNISNLSPLQSLTHLGESLNLSSCNSIVNLTGLEGLTTLSGTLYLDQNLNLYQFEWLTESCFSRKYSIIPKRINDFLGRIK
ncbi:MAG: hypothetical protein IPO92_19275 [Saprospiraceae bacterium]|nr:hypothetical protein [Saprospiraceae bacterium]